MQNTTKLNCELNPLINSYVGNVQVKESECISLQAAGHDGANEAQWRPGQARQINYRWK